MKRQACVREGRPRKGPRTSERGGRSGREGWNEKWSSSHKDLFILLNQKILGPFLSPLTSRPSQKIRTRKLDTKEGGYQPSRGVEGEGREGGTLELTLEFSSRKRKVSRGCDQS